VDERLAVTALAAEGGSLRLSLARCLSLFDEEGRFAPELDACSSIPDITADVVILAVGQRPERDVFVSLKRGRRGALEADSLTCLAPGKTSVFAAGDCVAGPTSVVEAMASGRVAALSVCRLLVGEPLESARDPYAVNGWTHEYVSRPGKAANGERGAEPRTPVSRGLQVESVATFSPEQARKEAERCLACGRSFEDKKTCWFCLPCEIECPQKALDVRIPYLAR
jgi:NADPH-dependent 2,4-dienoyl-CoA reductase/sulfur reductase-like enzyme